MARMQRNRESAMLSRQRKKMQLDELERQNKQLQASNTHLSGSTLYLSHLFSCTTPASVCTDAAFISSPLDKSSGCLQPHMASGLLPYFRQPHFRLSRQQGSSLNGICLSRACGWAGI